MKDKLILLAIIGLNTFWGFSQSGFTTLGGANFLGLSRAGTNLGGIKSMYHNQAGLADIDNIAADISFERRFNIEEFTNLSLVGAKKFKFGTFGILVSNFGFSQYSEQKFGVAYARKLHPNLSIGGQFDMLRYNIDKVGSKNLFTFELGMQLKLNNDFSLAAHVFSPGNVEVADATEIGSRFRMGLIFKPSKKVFLIAEIDKLIYRKPEVKIGMGYDIISDAQINIGINPVLNLYSFGVHFRIKERYRISSAIALHGGLGNTPALSLQYQK